MLHPKTFSEGKTQIYAQKMALNRVQVYTRLLMSQRSIEYDDTGNIECWVAQKGQACPSMQADMRASITTAEKFALMSCPTSMTTTSPMPKFLNMMLATSVDAPGVLQPTAFGSRTARCQHFATRVHIGYIVLPDGIVVSACTHAPRCQTARFGHFTAF